MENNGGGIRTGVLIGAMIRILALFVLLLSLSVPPVRAEESVTLVAGEYAPYVMNRQDRPGLLVEVVAAAFARSGVKTTVLMLPWRRCAMMVRQGDVFAAFPFAHTAKREEYAWFSDTIWTSRNVFFYLKGRLGDYDFTSFEDLRGFTIAGTTGHHYEEVFKAKGLSMDYASSEVSGIRKVWEERCALFADDELAGWALVNRVYPNRVGQFGSTPTPWAFAHLCLMVSKAYPGASGLLARFNEGLAAIRADGTYSRLAASYAVGSGKDGKQR